MLRFEVVNIQERLTDLIQEAIKRGLTPAEIARRSKGRITDSYISKIRSGSAGNVSLDRFEALADGMGLSPQQLCEALFGNPTKMPDEFGVSEFAHIYKLYNALPERAKKEARPLVDSLRLYLEFKRGGVTVAVYSVSDEKKSVRTRKQA